MEGWLEKWGNKCKTPWVIQLALLLFLAVGLGILYIQDKEPVVSVPEENPETSGIEIPVVETETDLEAAPEAVSEIFVHVSGQVNHPGVVCLPVGSRVYEAVEEAGGMTSDGDMESVNLAAVLMDQQKIVVGSMAERIALGNGQTEQTPVLLAENTANTDETQGKININTATKSELESLPGIGPVIAGNIIDYRQSNGAFQTIEEIKNVPRIGDVTFSNIQELIGVR